MNHSGKELEAEYQVEFSMKASQGKANPKLLREVLTRRLNAMP